MKSNRLAEIIINPAACTQEEISELSMLAEQYPYSSAIHILNARLASVNNTGDKDVLLTRAAICSPDRMRLKQFITTNEIYRNYKFIKSDPGATVTPEEPVPVTTSEDAIHYEPEMADEPGPGTEKETQDVATSDTLAWPEQPVSVTDPVTPVKGPEQDKPLETEKPADQDADVSRSVIYKIDKDSIPKAEPEGHSIADEIMKNLASYGALKAKLENIIEDSGNPQPSPDIEKTANPSDSTGTGESNPEKKFPIDNMDDVEEKFKEIIKPIQKKKSAKKMGKEEQDKLISKFIETDSTTSKQAKPGNRDKKSDEDLSLASSELKDEMITETLANILVNQGKLEKAIDIYRKLIWKLPQKKAYFAAKIESLKEKISKK